VESTLLFMQFIAIHYAIVAYKHTQLPGSDGALVHHTSVLTKAGSKVAAAKNNNFFLQLAQTETGKGKGGNSAYRQNLLFVFLAF